MRNLFINVCVTTGLLSLSLTALTARAEEIRVYTEEVTSIDLIAAEGDQPQQIKITFNQNGKEWYQNLTFTDGNIGTVLASMQNTLWKGKNWTGDYWFVFDFDKKDTSVMKLEVDPVRTAAKEQERKEKEEQEKRVAREKAAQERIAAQQKTAEEKRLTEQQRVQAAQQRAQAEAARIYTERHPYEALEQNAEASLIRKKDVYDYDKIEDTWDALKRAHESAIKENQSRIEEGETVSTILSFDSALKKSCPTISGQGALLLAEGRVLNASINQAKAEIAASQRAVDLIVRVKLPGNRHWRDNKGWAGDKWNAMWSKTGLAKKRRTEYQQIGDNLEAYYRSMITELAKIESNQRKILADQKSLAKLDSQFKGCVTAQMASIRIDAPPKDRRFLGIQSSKRASHKSGR